MLNHLPFKDGKPPTKCHDLGDGGFTPNFPGLQALQSLVPSGRLGKVSALKTSESKKMRKTSESMASLIHR